MGRARVWNTLGRNNRGRPPKGELLIEDLFLERAGVSRKEFLEELQADLVVLPAKGQAVLDWPDWRRRDYFTFALIDGPFQAMIAAWGWRRAAAQIVHNPGESRRFMARYLQNLRNLADPALDNGCEGLILADDLAGQRGLLLEPEYLRDYYFPAVQAWLRGYQPESTPVFFHSDGDITAILTDIKGAGFWGVQGLQPDAGMYKEALAPEILREMVFWGSFQFEGPRGLKTAREVQEDAARLCGEWQGLAYIFGSCGGLYADLPPDLVRAAYRALP